MNSLLALLVGASWASGALDGGAAGGGALTQRVAAVRPLRCAVRRLRGGSEMDELRDAEGIAEEGFGGIWGGPVLWREGYHDPLEDRVTGWEHGGKCHGACVSWCDCKDDELTRAAQEGEQAQSDQGASTDSDDESDAAPVTSARFPFAGEFGGLFEAFEAAAEEEPASINSSFAVLRADTDEPLKSQIVYASPLFASVMRAPSPDALLGKPWGDFYGQMDAEKREHFASVCKNIGEACESRFVLPEKWWEDTMADEGGVLPAAGGAGEGQGESRAVESLQEEMRVLRARLAKAETLLGLQADNKTRTAVLYAEPIVYGAGGTTARGLSAWACAT